MNAAKFGVITLIVLCNAAATNAAIIAYHQKLNHPRRGRADGQGFTAPETQLNNFEWNSYQYFVRATAGERLSAVDVFIQGEFHQRWADIDFDGIPDPTPVGLPANSRGDAHLTPIAGALIGSAPEEDNSGMGSPLENPPPGVQWGVGTYLSGAWGVPGGDATEIAIAQLVLPWGKVSDFDLRVIVANDQGAPFTFRTLDFVPEPTSLMLLSLGLIRFGIWRYR